MMKNLYEEIGGALRLRSLVDTFYDVMDSAPEAKKIRELHPPSLKQSREKLFMFLSGVFGGPERYREKYGHPRLRAKHLPFPIGVEERDQWIFCMKIAIKKSKLAIPLEKKLTEYFENTANHMINKNNPADPFNIRN